VKSSLKKIITVTIFFAFAALILYLAFKDVDFSVLVNGFKQVNYFWVSLSMIVGLVSHIIRALRWQLLIEPLGHKPSLKNTLGALGIGYVSNIVIPRFGEIARCGSLRKTDKIPLESLLGTVIVERAFDVLMILLLVATTFFIRLDFFGNFLWNEAFLPIYSKIFYLLEQSPIYAIAGLLILVGLFLLIKRNLLGTRINNRLTSIFWGTMDGVKSVYTMKKRKRFFAYTLIMWFLYWLMTMLIVLSTQATLKLGASDALFLMVVGTFGMAAPVQGGFGAFHVITAMALGIYGVSWEDGLIYAIISHESQTLLILLIGITFITYLFWEKRLLPQNNTTHSSIIRNN
jgi:glycosyltransferase 2 family protein